MQTRKVWILLPIALAPFFLLSGCSSAAPLYSLTATVSFNTQTEDTNPDLPQKNNGIFLCSPSGTQAKASDLIGQPDMISIMDETWSGSDLEIYDAAKNLVGVADSAIPSIQSDGVCQIVFKYSNLKLTDAPLRLETQEGSYWDIPESQWKTGSVSLNGAGAKF